MPSAPAPTRPPAGFRAPGTARFHLSHVPALDGLRGVAVAGVVLFHTQLLDGRLPRRRPVLLAVRLPDHHAAAGGAHHHARDRGRDVLDPPGPPVAARRCSACWSVSACTPWFFADPVELGRLRGDALATLFYVANWHSIVAEQGYWDLFAAPSPLQHTWSLAIEEQFYLVWPSCSARCCGGDAGSLRVVVAFCLAMPSPAPCGWRSCTTPTTCQPRLPRHRHADAGVADRRRVGGVAAVAGPHAVLPRPRRDRGRRPWRASAAVLAMWALLDGTSPFLYRGGSADRLDRRVRRARLGHPSRSAGPWRPRCRGVPCAGSA